MDFDITSNPKSDEYIKNKIYKLSSSKKILKNKVFPVTSLSLQVFILLNIFVINWFGSTTDAIGGVIYGIIFYLIYLLGIGIFPSFFFSYILTFIWHGMVSSTNQFMIIYVLIGLTLCVTHAIFRSRWNIYNDEISDLSYLDLNLPEHQDLAKEILLICDKSSECLSYAAAVSRMDRLLTLGEAKTLKEIYRKGKAPRPQANPEIEYIRNQFKSLHEREVI